MNFAKKFREVVVANFVEISRPEDEAQDEAVEEREEVVLPTSSRVVDAPATVTPMAAAPDAAVMPVARPVVPTGSGESLPAAGLVVDSTSSSPAFQDQHQDALLAAAQGFADVFATAQAAEHAPVGDPLELIAEDGNIDFNRWYAAGGLAKSATFTAETALNVLLGLPSDLPLRAKRQMLKITLDTLGQNLGASTGDIVADAERKRSRLEEFVADVTARTSELRDAEDAEIARLRAEIAEREAKIQDLDERRDRAVAATRDRVDQFSQVVAFFTVSDAAPEEPAAESADAYAEEDLPAFMREDAVFRMLGIDGASTEDEASANGDHAGTPEDDTDGSAAVAGSKSTKKRAA